MKNNWTYYRNKQTLYSREEFLRRAEYLRRIYKKTLTLGGQRYGLLQQEVDHSIEEMNKTVDQYIADFEDLGSLSVISQYIRDEAKSEVQELISRRGNTNMIPVCNIMEASFEVDEVYSDMRLREDLYDDNCEKSVKCEDILQDSSVREENPVILIEGGEGVGKTMLVKKILSEWQSNQPSSIRDLDTYDLVFLTECRHPKRKSFDDIMLFIMPRTLMFVGSDALKEAVLSQKCLIILDGLDNLNQSSANLFKELLHLKKTHPGLTLLITTQPKRLEYYYECTEVLEIKTRHIKLLGIPGMNREAFCSSYHNAIKRKCINAHHAEELSGYLKRQGLHNQDLWRLPYNLAVIVLIWIHNPAAGNNITTSVELYWEMFKVFMKKACERASTVEDSTSFEQPDVKKKVENCLHSLGREALVSMLHDDGTLSGESFKRFSDVCVQERIPREEMSGAFMKKFITSRGNDYRSLYCYRQRGLQDFFGALYIFREMKNKSQKDSLSTVPVEQSDSVRSLLQDLDPSQPIEIWKFKQVFIMLLGLIYLNETSINNSLKMEVLELMQETGIQCGGDWLRILDETKCDPFVANFISRQDGVLGREVRIDNFSANSYISLFQSLQSPLNENQKAEIVIDFRGNYAHLWDHLKESISFHGLKVKKIYIYEENWSFYHSKLKSLPKPPTPLTEIDLTVDLCKKESIKEILDFVNSTKIGVEQLDFGHLFISPEMQFHDAIAEILRRCHIKRYYGQMFETMSFPESIRYLCVSVTDTRSFSPLKDFILSKRNKLSTLIVSVNLTVDIDCLIPLEGMAGETQWTSLFLPDVTTFDDVVRAGEMARRLMPSDKGRFFALWFPRCRFGDTHLLIQELQSTGIKVGGSLALPRNLCPSSQDKTRELNELVRDKLGGYYGIEWGGHSCWSSIVWDLDMWE